MSYLPFSLVSPLVQTDRSTSWGRKWTILEWNNNLETLNLGDFKDSLRVLGELSVSKTLTALAERKRGFVCVLCRCVICSENVSVALQIQCFIFFFSFAWNQYDLFNCYPIACFKVYTEECLYHSRLPELHLNHVQQYDHNQALAPLCDLHTAIDKQQTSNRHSWKMAFTQQDRSGR